MVTYKEHMESHRKHMVRAPLWWAEPTCVVGGAFSRRGGSNKLTFSVPHLQPEREDSRMLRVSSKGSLSLLFKEFSFAVPVAACVTFD